MNKWVAVSLKIVIIRSNSVQPDPRVEKEVRCLVNCGHEVQILAWDRLNDSGGEKYGTLKFGKININIRWFLIPSSFGGGIKNIGVLFLFQVCLFFWLLKHRKEFDVIHSCDFDTVVPSRICSFLLRKKLVYDIFDYYVDSFQVPNLLKPVIEKLDISIINSADAVIITNESRLKQISKSKPRKTVVIHNSPENVLHELSDFSGPKRKEKLVYVGILSHHRLLIEVSEIIIKNKDYELHIGGFGVLDKYFAELASKENNIFYYGKLTYEDALKLENECDIMFATYDPKVPNHKYSSPNKLYEAMMLGKPLIVAKDTGIDEIVDLHGLGVSIDYNKNFFEEALYLLTNQRDQREELKSRSQQLYHQSYSWSIMHDRLERLYKELN